jgi:hypothetical protein
MFIWFCFLFVFYSSKLKTDFGLIVIQQYPLGTQNNYIVFLNLFVVTETGKELKRPKGGKGF